MQTKESVPASHVDVEAFVCLLNWFAWRDAREFCAFYARRA